MGNADLKLVVIITPDGVESVTVQASDIESRNAGYATCQALEPAFASVDKIVGELYAPREGAGVQ